MTTDEVRLLHEELQQLRERETSLQQRNAVLSHRVKEHQGRLASLLQIITALRATRDSGAVVNLVSRHAVQLIPGADCAMIWIVDSSKQRLELHSVNGEPAPPVSLRPGQGIAGRGYLAPRAMKFTGADLQEALAEHGEDGQRALAAALDSYWPPHSAIGAPLRTENEGLGTVVLSGSTQSHLLLASDLAFVQALADLIAFTLADMRHEHEMQQLDQALHRSQQLHADAQQQLTAVQAGLLQSAKLAAVGQLAASVAHEINNPLYAVRTSLYLVGQDLAADAPEREYLDLAQQELGRIARIIARMREFYKPSTSDFQLIDLNDLVAETLHLAATHLEHASIEVVQQLAPNLPAINVSADRIRQVLLNLVLNAGDAMSHGGRLAVRTMLDGTDIVVQIADTGTGIPPEIKDRLFEPFFTTKASGTGLGLSVSYHIVAQHGGQLDIDSEVGQGTTCTVRLPLNYVPRVDANLTAGTVSAA